MYRLDGHVMTFPCRGSEQKRREPKTENLVFPILPTPPPFQYAHAFREEKSGEE
jgi:hypothetical protein